MGLPGDCEWQLECQIRSGPTQWEEHQGDSDPLTDKLPTTEKVYHLSTHMCQEELLIRPYT